MKPWFAAAAAAVGGAGTGRLSYEIKDIIQNEVKNEVKKLSEKVKSKDSIHYLF